MPAKQSKYRCVAPSARMSNTQIHNLNLHPYAYQVLLNNPEYIIWDLMQYNRYGNYPIYAHYPNQITWIAIKSNPRLIELIPSEISDIDWSFN